MVISLTAGRVWPLFLVGWEAGRGHHSDYRPCMATVSVLDGRQDVVISLTAGRVWPLSLYWMGGRTWSSMTAVVCGHCLWLDWRQDVVINDCRPCVATVSVPDGRQGVVINDCRPCVATVSGWMGGRTWSSMTAGRVWPLCLYWMGGRTWSSMTAGRVWPLSLYWMGGRTWSSL